MTTLGDFLQEKAFNMRKWARQALDRPELLGEMDMAVKTDFVAMGIRCVSVKQSILRRDWHGLMTPLIDTPIFEIAQMLRANEELHDKFWRYLELFVNVTEQANFQSDEYKNAVHVKGQ